MTQSKTLFNPLWLLLLALLALLIVAPMIGNANFPTNGGTLSTSAGAQVSSQQFVTTLTEVEMEAINNHILYMGTRHQETQLVVQIANANARNGRIEGKGDGPSRGSIQTELWFGFLGDGMRSADPTKGAFVILINTSTGVKFILIEGNFRVGPESGWTRIADTMYYYKPDSLIWKCAWTMTKSIGHGEQPENMRLDWGASQAQLAYSASKWNVRLPLVGFPIPLPPFTP